jgi:hypothetical protein
VGVPHFLIAVGRRSPWGRGPGAGAEGYRDIRTITMMSTNTATSANWNISSRRCSRFIVPLD